MIYLLPFRYFTVDCCTKCSVGGLVGVVQQRNQYTGFFAFVVYSCLHTFMYYSCMCGVPSALITHVLMSLVFLLCLVVDCLSVSVVVVHHRFACTTCPNSPANVGRFSWRWAKSNPPSFCAVPCLLGCGVWGCAARLYLLFFSLCSYVS